MLICVGVLFVCILSWGIPYAIRDSNVSSIEKAYTNSCKAANNCKPGNHYDQKFTEGPYSDKSLGRALKAVYDKECDDNCKLRGLRWSDVYSLNTWLMVILLLQLTVMTAGIYNFHARMTAYCCGCCYCIFHLVVLIITGVLRFNIKGSLGSISQTSSAFKEPSIKNGTDFISGDRTYESDGDLILGLWIFQFFFFCFHCCGAGWLSKLPTRSDLD